MACKQLPEMDKRSLGAKLRWRYAHAMTDSPLGGLTTDEWCRKFGVTRCHTTGRAGREKRRDSGACARQRRGARGVVQRTMRCGKPVYVDKTFAPTCHRSAFFRLPSTQALPAIPPPRCATPQNIGLLRQIWSAPPACGAEADYENYSVHLLEPLVMLMKGPPDG